MVCATELLTSGTDTVNINDFTLIKYTTAKFSEPIYSISYEINAGELQSTKHAQLQCPELVWPFIKTGTVYAEVPIMAAHTLAEPDIDAKGKHVMELTIEMESCSDCQPGDTIAILPSNSSSDVHELLERMQLLQKSNSIFQLQISPRSSKKNAKLPTYIPAHCTPYRLLHDCLNIHATPKKQFLNALANCCVDTNECAFLRCLSSKEATAYYNELIMERGLTLLELLELCPSCKPTLEILIEYLPRLLPRPYSIANSPTTNEIKIIFSILTRKPGVTTNMLNSLAKSLSNAADNEERSKIILYVRQPSKFRFTELEASENNHILIGIGTALAPYLGFLEQKEQLLAKGAFKTLGDTWLFAGAYTEKSLPHRDRILAFEKDGVLQRYFECLSRVPSSAYRYVQEQLLAHARLFVEFLLQDNTILYVCADGGTISKKIEKAIAECLIQVQQITAEDAQQAVKAFKQSGKYREDLWL